MALKKVYFLSDLHLGASYFADPRAKERAVVQWLDSIKNTAAEIYLLGDILDYWYEYRTVVPRGYVRFLGKLAELSDAGVKLHWFIGNHDIWIFDYLPSEIGVEVIDGSVEREIMGKRFFLAHGDGVGRHEWSFALIRGIFRNSVNGYLLPCIRAGPFPLLTAGRATAAGAMACNHRRKQLPPWSNSQRNMQPRIPESTILSMDTCTFCATSRWAQIRAWWCWATGFRSIPGLNLMEKSWF